MARPARGPAALLRAACLLACASVAAAAAAGRQTGEADRELAIPQWRIDKALSAVAVKDPEAAAPSTRGEEGPAESPEDSKLPKLGSTAAQDSGRCPLVKLPSKLGMKAEESSWVSQGGTWQSSSDVIHSSFRLWFLSTSWDTAYIRNLDMQPAFRADVSSDEELEYSYGWKRQKTPLDYPAVNKLEKDWWAAISKGIQKGRYTPLKAPGEKYGVSVDDPKLWHTVALLDCEGHLLFVVKLQQQEIRTIPGGIDVYDRQGGLVAHAMVDFQIARYQFVDTNGNLIATAEAPGVGLNIVMENLQSDASKGNILPHEIQFEKGGYVGASRLADVDYRWVVAAAVQARALDDAHRNWAPWAPGLLVAMCCLLGVMTLLLICCACGAIYRLVYPKGDVGALPPLWDKKAQPQQWYAAPEQAS